MKTVYKILAQQKGTLISPLMRTPYDSMKKTYPLKGWGPLTAWRTLRYAELDAKCLIRLPGLDYLEVWECEAQTLPRKTGVWYPGSDKKRKTEDLLTGVVLCRWIRLVARVGKYER